ncbi:Ribosomal protein S18 acetylase RimI [Actinopolyspora mzabensis]|uniref:Ribosomal protein S18 acetylase RimI n=1 Tax=Actinopolyspora mzabensis TaxID=995066 RepID=A0A1G9FJ00_ACTMZ|nr:GNAT family N-acetyltransferase [Actinopolyspora mzabensis]SDK88307.1 Ribosomal protein S18 acetylase RimI [Actinopolyspora mzabensis]
MSKSPSSEITVSAVDVEAAESVGLLREYFAEMTARYLGRQPTDHEIESSMAEDPSTDLSGDTGRFLVARVNGRPVGCVGLRHHDERTGELTRMFVVESSRRQGLGASLLHAAERTAVELGMRAIRLDTRGDLVEARKLYAANGYEEIEPYSDALYADHWFEKRL